MPDKPDHKMVRAFRQTPEVRAALEAQDRGGVPEYLRRLVIHHRDRWRAAYDFLEAQEDLNIPKLVAAVVPQVRAWTPRDPVRLVEEATDMRGLPDPDARALLVLAEEVACANTELVRRLEIARIHGRRA